MPFHPPHRPRRHRVAQGRARRFVLAALTLLAFTAALIGCLHHTEAAPPSPAASSAAVHSAAAHDHRPRPHHPHHPLFTGDSRGAPEHDESCIPDYPSRTVQESSAPRPASVPVLFAAVLGLFGARLPVRGQRRGSPFPVRAREGRTTQATVCCWRI